MTTLFLLMTGCFKLPADMNAVDTTVVPFDNPHVTVDDAVIQGFDVVVNGQPLTCPNGDTARFFTVYSTQAVEPAPAAVVLHSGAFDYVMEAADETDPLEGPHYHARSRLDAAFGNAKVWETLGLQIDDLDPAENNQGTLPAAIVNNGMLQLIPANCWGDLWHNEDGVQYNDANLDGFSRNGRTLAWYMVRLITEAGFADQMDIELPVSVDPEQLYLFGLGEGGRGVVELLLHDDMPPVAGALVDSSPDDLRAYLDDPIAFEDEIEGLSRIFREEGLEHVEDWSLTADVPLPERLVYLWSDGDPQLLAGSARPAAVHLADTEGVVVSSSHTSDHVLSNSDNNRAHAVVEYLTTGTIPEGL